MLFQAFEKFVHPYPDTPVAPPPQGLMPFLWACSAGTRRYIALMTLCTAGIGALEALLFAVLLISIVYVLTSLLADFVYAAVDPRIRLER